MFEIEHVTEQKIFKKINDADGLGPAYTCWSVLVLFVLMKMKTRDT